MYRLWISTCCFIVCLIINNTPSSIGAATAPSSSKPQHKQVHNHQTETSDIKPPSTAIDDSENIVTFTKGSRNKRELTDTHDQMKMAKRIRSFFGKRDWDLNPQNPAVGSEYPGLPPVQVWYDTADGELYLRYPEDEESLMNARNDNPDDDDVYRDVTKRLRSFVGKRGSIQFGIPHNGDWYHENDQELQLSKRLRNFVGKRLRSFIGKRDDIKKRTRKFVGKRTRNFVGKRDSEYDFGNDLFLQDKDKRLQGSVDKRPRTFIGKRIRSFFGKRGNGIDEQYHDLFRNTVLKESSPFFSNADEGMGNFLANRKYGDEWETLELPSPYTFNDGFDISADKRLRNFVGKRSRDDLIETQKRLRSFIGKREDKRLRSFIGKRSDDAQHDVLDFGVPKPSKRLRSFIGKRSDRDTSAVEKSMISKRLRDFVGKRDSGVSKRLRSFVGRR